MTTYVALFRGINVGGRQGVRMDELKSIHEALGLKNVVTYIRTGNVLFTSDDTDIVRLSERIGDAFTEKFGFRVDVMIRTFAEIEDLMIALVCGPLLG